ncbi:hypothetical protein D4Q76_01175 [archaeon]|nr:MAG: hypothetical protein D4Q76_01175 [archaeon]
MQKRAKELIKSLVIWIGVIGSGNLRYDFLFDYGGPNGIFSHDLNSRGFSNIFLFPGVFFP